MQEFKTPKSDLKATACVRCGKNRSTNPGSMTWWIFRRSCDCQASPSQARDQSDGEPLAPLDTTRLLGSTLSGKYNLVKLLAAGGMGHVFEARTTDGRRVAVKVIRKELAENQALLRRFEQEIEAASSLTHEHLVNLLDHGISSEGLPYLVMDFVDGHAFNSEIVRTTQNWHYALDLFIQIASGLAYAHSQNILHRDIKPSNIVVTTSGGSPKAVVVDFGIAKAKEDFFQTRTALTNTGEVVGSPLYLSPERCQGFPADEQSDIYAFACVMYEAIKGFPPFEGSNPIEIMFAHCSQEPEPFFKPGISSDLSRLIFQCLKKNPEERYESMSNVHSDLLRIKAGQKLGFFPKPKLINRKTAPIAIFAAIALCVTAGLTLRASLAGTDIINQNSKAVIFSSKEKSLKRAAEDALRKQQDLSYADFHGADLQGLTITGKRFAHLNLSKANLQNAVLVNCLFDNINLEGANLAKASIDAAMRDGNFKNTNFASAKVENDFAMHVLDNCVFTDANLTNSVFVKSVFKSCNLSNAYVSACLAEGAVFTNCNLRSLKGGMLKAPESTFSRSDLTNANLQNCDLSKAHFLNTGLTRTILSDSNLTSADLRKADLDGSNLMGANLTGANLEEANLKGANLRNANLTRASLKGALLRGADLRGANLKDVQLTADQLSEAKLR